MKEISDLYFPSDVLYAQDHEWARSSEDSWTVGISDYAQDQLGDIVFVELPQVGDSYEKGKAFGTLESVKAVAELYMPISGEVLSVNSSLESAPELINKKPYEDGWMIVIKPSDPSQLDSLMKRDIYLEMLKGLE